jgi:hypothetical protein
MDHRRSVRYPRFKRRNSCTSLYHLHLESIEEAIERRNAILEDPSVCLPRVSPNAQSDGLCVLEGSGHEKDCEPH